MLATVWTTAALAAPELAWTPETPLAAEDLRADVAVLRQAYGALHPGLHRYATPREMDAAFAALDRAFAHGATLAEAYLAFSRFASSVRCGHTYANFFNQRRAVQHALFERGRVPFTFRWLDGRMIVTHAFTDSLRPGDEIAVLDGIPAATILARLMPYGRADGHNDAKRVASLQVDGTSRYEAFDIFWPLLCPHRDDAVTAQVRAPSGARRPVRLALQSYDARLASLAALEPTTTQENAPLWQCTPLADGAALLRMPTWVTYNSSWPWQAWLDSTFAALAGGQVRDVVIDLRGNEGGSDVGDAIVSHLIAAPVPRQQVVRLVRYRRVPDALRPVLDTWDPSFFDWGDAAKDSSAQWFRLRRDADDDVGGTIAPRAPRFDGRVWVLVGATNSSATFEFARTVRQNHLGTLVGQPTGGNQRGINGGCFFFLRLPRTGLELDVPLIGQFSPAPQPDAGLDPDVRVDPTAADIAAGRDVELDAVRARLTR